MVQQIPDQIASLRATLRPRCFQFRPGYCWPCKLHPSTALPLTRISIHTNFKKAGLAIYGAAQRIDEKLSIDGLETARESFPGTMPTAEQLMPAITLQLVEPRLLH
jgi:hypothetical protein